MFVETRSRSASSRKISLQQCASTALAWRLVPLSAKIRNCDAMKENPENDRYARGKRRPSAWKPLATAAAIIAVIQACLTIRGRGIEGFVLWVIILFVAYWLFFTFLRWLWGRLKDRR